MFELPQSRPRSSSLSGGNQQKLIIAREFAAEPMALIAAQPTRGVDIGAIEFIHRRLIELRDAGKASYLSQPSWTRSARSLIVLQSCMRAKLSISFHQMPQRNNWAS